MAGAHRQTRAAACVCHLYSFTLRYKHVHQKTLEPPSRNDDEEASGAQDADRRELWDMETEQAEAEPAQPPPRQDKRLEAFAKAELQRYVSFVIAPDLTDSAAIQSNLKLQPGSISGYVRFNQINNFACLTTCRVEERIRPPSEERNQRLRAWWYDSSLLFECAESYSKSHNPWSRAPPFCKQTLHLNCISPGRLHIIKVLFVQSSRSTVTKLFGQFGRDGEVSQQIIKACGE